MFLGINQIVRAGCEHQIHLNAEELLTKKKQTNGVLGKIEHNTQTVQHNTISEKTNLSKKGRVSRTPNQHHPQRTKNPASAVTFFAFVIDCCLCVGV